MPFKQTDQPSTQVARPEGSAYDLLVAASDYPTRLEAARYAVEAVPVPGFEWPVPRMFFDLPWANDGESVVDDILAQVAAAEDLEVATSNAELTDPYDILGQPVTVLGVVARQSQLTVRPGENDPKWGAYLTLTCSVAGAPPEVINTGSGEVCVVMWRLYCGGLLPAHGVFDVKGQPVKGRKQPLTFRLESELK